MAVNRNSPKNAVTNATSTTTNSHANKSSLSKAPQSTKHNISPAIQKGKDSSPDIANEHLPPLALTFVVLACSGFLLMFGLRDFMMTGRNILGTMDEAYLLFTKSTDWFQDTKGWKSTQGGFSAIQPVTTDENNMGGLFVRKIAGAAMTGVQLQKLVPLLFHPSGAQWNLGHFRPLLASSAAVNIALVVFLSLGWEDLVAGGAHGLVQLWMAALVLETVVFLYYTWSLSRTKAQRGPAVAMTDGKTPSSLPSGIVSRTILMVTPAIAVFMVRDLFFSGQIMSIIPLDDIYLEWTNALRHSPPDGSPEALDYGLEAPLYVGDKFISQFMAMNMLLLCFYKFFSAYGIRYGADGRGEIQAKMFWTVQAVGNAMVLFLFRLFVGAAASASIDMRWYVVAIAYETFILGIYGFF